MADTRIYSNAKSAYLFHFYQSIVCPLYVLRVTESITSKLYNTRS